MILFVVWTVMTHLMMFIKEKTEGCHWSASRQTSKKDFAGPLFSRASRVLGLLSRHRVADVLHQMKIVSRASRPGLLFFFYASHVSGSGQHRDFTLKNMITPAVLDAQMNLTLSHTTMSQVVQHFCFFLETCCDSASS